MIPYRINNKPWWILQKGLQKKLPALDDFNVLFFNRLYEEVKTVASFILVYLLESFVKCLNTVLSIGYIVEEKFLINIELKWSMFIASAN